MKEKSGDKYFQLNYSSSWKPFNVPFKISGIEVTIPSNVPAIGPLNEYGRDKSDSFVANAMF